MQSTYFLIQLNHAKKIINLLNIISIDKNEDSISKDTYIINFINNQQLIIDRLDYKYMIDQLHLHNILLY